MSNLSVKLCKKLNYLVGKSDQGILGWLKHENQICKGGESVDNTFFEWSILFNC